MILLIQNPQNDKNHSNGEQTGGSRSSGQQKEVAVPESGQKEVFG